MNHSLLTELDKVKFVDPNQSVRFRRIIQEEEAEIDNIDKEIMKASNFKYVKYRTSSPSTNIVNKSQNSNDEVVKRHGRKN